MKKIIYVSGPMTGIKDNNVPAFNDAAKKLRQKGFKVVNPADLDKGEPCRTWEACLRRDIKWLVTCHEIATLPGWKKSKGANLEIHIGKSLSFPIHTVTYYLRKRG
jgi:hypothetical protein